MKTTVYTPDSALRRPGALLVSVLNDLASAHYLAKQMFLRDVRAQYRQSLLGYLWLFFPPLVNAAIFVYLNSQKIFDVGETPVAYPAYALLGTLLWQNFVDAMNSPLRIATANKPMLTKINFPREALLLAGVYEVGFNFAVRLLLLVPIMLYFQTGIHASMWLFPLGMLALITMGTLVGVLLAPLGLLYGDIARGMGLLVIVWMLLTPVVYPPPAGGIAELIANWNPVAPLLVNTRAWLIGTPAMDFGVFMLIFGVSLVVLAGGWLIYRVSLPHLIARMGM